MILSAAELEAAFLPQTPPAEDTGATQAMPALVLPESFRPPFAEEEQVLPVEDSNFRTMAMKIPTADELAAASPIEFVAPPRGFSPPPPPPPRSTSRSRFRLLLLLRLLSTGQRRQCPFRPRRPPSSSRKSRPSNRHLLHSTLSRSWRSSLRLPPPFSSRSRRSSSRHLLLRRRSTSQSLLSCRLRPSSPAFYEPEPAFFVPPIPPPPPAFYEPESAPQVEPAAPFEPESDQASEPFLVEMESPGQITPATATETPFEFGPDSGATSVPEEIEVALYDVVPEAAAEEAPETPETPVTPAAAEPALDLLVEEPVPVVEEPVPAAEAAVVEVGAAEPFPEMDEAVPVAETEAAPWDEGPAIEIPPPPPELSGGPEDTEGTEPITRDIEADLEAFEASGRVTRRPEIWERHAALIGEEAPAGIDMHGTSIPEELPTPAMEDPSSSELEAMAAAARIEDLSALIPSTSAPVMPAAISLPLPSEGTQGTHETAMTTAPLGTAAPSGLSDADVDRIARRVVQLLSDKAVRDIAWEVVPEYAERLVRERIAEVERAG